MPPWTKTDEFSSSWKLPFSTKILRLLGDKLALSLRVQYCLQKLLWVLNVKQFAVRWGHLNFNIFCWEIQDHKWCQNFVHSVFCSANASHLDYCQYLQQNVNSEKEQNFLCNGNEKGARIGWSKNPLMSWQLLTEKADEQGLSLNLEAIAIQSYIKKRFFFRSGQIC